ncbi:GGDEF domain-containing protein [uncultured Shewanella sp.]|uniref:tetratricopeptide repeat-containing diguanylate cyclase n=1 Tax=uncultured Shewanella sp. TaxID=173975 RepID=UPI0026331FBA|nr:GGDEF domain-containing protein [uncultured Shewanella sp.]
MKALNVVVLFIAIIVFSNTVVAVSDIYNEKLDELSEVVHSNPERTLILIEDLSSAQDELTTEQYSRLLVLQSVQNLYSAEFELAIDALQRAESFNPSEKLLNSIYLYQASAYLGLHEYQQALDVMSTNLSRIEELEDTDIKISSYLRLVNLYLDLQAYGEMSRYAELALTLSRGKSAKNECYSLLYLAVAELKTEKLERAEGGFKSSRDFCQLNNLPVIVAMSKKGLGEVAIKRANYAVAEGYLLQALEEYRPFKFQIEIDSIHSLLSETYLGLSQTDKAQEYAGLVMALPDEPVNLSYKKRATKVLAELANERGEYAQAYQYLSQHQAITNILHDDTKAKANAYQMAKFENGEKSREINLLNHERELYTAREEMRELKQNNDRMGLLIVGGGFVLLAMFAVAITGQKRKYKKLAQFDALTGILNRDTAQNIAENRYIKDSFKSLEFSVVMFDLDHFKRINDNFGHGTGDWVLKRATEAISKNCRSADIFTRFAGEEFVLFLPATDAETAVELAEQHRLVIEAMDTKYSGREFKLSASFGVTSSSDADLSLDPLLHRADIAMQYSKEQGRNCVTLYSREIGLSRSPTYIVSPDESPSEFAERSQAEG